MDTCVVSEKSIKMKQKCKAAYKIKTDVISVRSKLMNEIDLPVGVDSTSIGVRKNLNPINTLKSFTLERIDELSRAQSPEGKMLKYVLNFIKKCNKAKLQIHKETEEESAVNNWSVYSEVDSLDIESDEEFENRLNEIGRGDRLKRRSTLVPDPVIKKVRFPEVKQCEKVSVMRKTTTEDLLKLYDKTKLIRK